MRTCDKNAKLTTCKILIADNYLDAAESLRELLALFDNEIRIAYTGLEAIKTAQEFQPDIAILEVVLPEMSGLEVARHLRKEPSLCNTMLVALTGMGQERYRQSAKEAGFDYYFLKPDGLQPLTEVIQGYKQGS